MNKGPSKYRFTKAWRERNPEKISAHRRVYVAVRNGTLKPEPCWCGKDKTQAHHKDYKFPLKVIWLCSEHHAEADRELGLRKRVFHS